MGNVGPQGAGSNTATPDKETLQVVENVPKVPLGSAGSSEQNSIASITKDEKLLAAVIYGEGSSSNVFEEMAGIASVLIRQANARGQQIGGFLASNEAKTFTFVLVDGNPRYKLLSSSTDVFISKNAGMSTAVKAARHALTGKEDYSGGGYFWDGSDLKENFENHPKVLKGIRFAKKEHDIYDVGDHKIKEEIKYWMKLDKDGNTIQGGERGRYDCTYESTAASGGTVFWRYTPEYIKATGSKEFK